MWFQQHHQNFANQRLPSVDPVFMTATREAPDWVKLTHLESKLARMHTLRKHMAECDIEFSEVTARLQLGQSSGSDSGERAFAEYTQRLKDVAQRINAMSAEYDEIDFSLKASVVAHDDTNLTEEGPAAMAFAEVAGIGALLKLNKHSIIKFVALHPVGAAARSRQVHEDDRLVAVDGVVVRGMTPQEVAPLIRGPVGSEIELELLRPAATQCNIVTLVRQPLLLVALQQEWV
jgi:C-terminal processing protease CtpA/Prc